MKQGIKQPAAIAGAELAPRAHPIKVAYKKNVDIHQNLIALFILKMKGSRESTALTDAEEATEL